MDLDKRLTEKFEELFESPAPAAPTRPGTIPRTPRPSSPNPGKTPKPWNPPRPKVDPTPKNKRDIWKPRKPQFWDKQNEGFPSESAIGLLAMLCEGYDDEVHPYTRDFWRGLKGGGHQFSKHPIFSAFGDELSRSSFEHTSDRAKKAGLQSRPNASYRHRLIQAIIQLESQHADELIALAKQITATIWECPEDILQGQLTVDVEQNTTGLSGDSGEMGAGEEVEISSPEVEKLINKRITMNTLAHGSSVHAMLTLHHAVDEAIKKIDPRLLVLYNKLSSGAHQEYWLWDIPEMFGQSVNAQHAGSSSIKYQDDSQPIVDARALCFPVLAQEMSKGVAELLSHHGLSDLDEPTTRTVLGKADAVQHEPWLIQIGPEIWRRFLAVRPREIPLAQLYQALAMQEPDELHRIIYTVIKEPDEAREILSALVANPEEFDIDDASADDQYDDGDEEEHFDTGSGWVDSQ